MTVVISVSIPYRYSLNGNDFENATDVIMFQFLIGIL